MALAWLVTAATDEGGVSWGERAGRALPLTPGCAAVGTWAALAPALARGEKRALEALGRSPARTGLAAAIGASAVALVAALAVAGLQGVDVAGFYPTAARARAWHWDGQGFVDEVRGIAVDAEGTPHRASPAPGAPSGIGAVTLLPPHARAAAALALAAAGMAFPLLVARAMLRSRFPSRRALRPPGASRLPADTLVASAVVAASLVLFQAAAARRSPALLAAAPPVLLVAFALHRYRTTS